MEVMPSRQESRAKLHLQQGALENHCRPAVDVLFRSASAVYGPATLAVVLTGMGSDGLASSRLIRTQGGTVLAQDQASSAVWGMPGAVVQAGIAHRVLPLTAIGPEMIRLACRNQSEVFDVLDPRELTVRQWALRPVPITPICEKWSSTTRRMYSNRPMTIYSNHVSWDFYIGMACPGSTNWFIC